VNSWRESSVSRRSPTSKLQLFSITFHSNKRTKKIDTPGTSLRRSSKRELMTMITCLGQLLRRRKWGRCLWIRINSKNRGRKKIRGRAISRLICGGLREKLGLKWTVT
jgi:hypothetical protein